MVCDRCIATVREVLQNLGYNIDSVSLGNAVVSDEIEGQLDEIDSRLKEKGFELIREYDQALITEIKAQLINYLKHIEDEEEPQKLSEFLSDCMHRNYSYLSSLFSNHQKLTIEQHLIHLKIERVKELLTYDDMTLSEIAWKLNYSSVQYLSNQFKKVTGETVSTFRRFMSENSRKSLDSIS